MSEPDVRCTAIENVIPHPHSHYVSNPHTLICVLRSGHDGKHVWVERIAWESRT